MNDPIRFARLDPKTGVAVVTVRESEQRAQVEAFAASNALYRRGQIAGYFDALWHYRPQPRFRVETPEEVAEQRARYLKIAEERYPENGQ